MRSTPHLTHQPVKTERGLFLERGIRRPVIADAIDHLTPVFVRIDHFLDRMDIVLQVRVDGDHGVTLADGIHQTCPQRVLVSHIVRQFQPMGIRALLLKPLNDFPGPVLAAVVHIHDPAVVQDISGNPLAYQLRELPVRLRKDGLFIITRDDDVQYHLLDFFENETDQKEIDGHDDAIHRQGCPLVRNAHP